MKKTELTKSSWPQVKAALKERFSTISERDLSYVNGKEEKLHTFLQEKLGKSRAEVDKIIESVHSSVKEKTKGSKDSQ
jgi:uncharacterized protein YjbJ (UPF0337 family)